VRVRLVPGQTPEDFDDAARALASARGVAQCQVRELAPNLPAPSYVELDVAERKVAVYAYHGGDPIGVLGSLLLSAYTLDVETGQWWRKEADGEPEAVRLILVNAPGTAVGRQTFNQHIWDRAFTRAKIKKMSRVDGMHALRHFYASVLLDAGESIKALAEWLGHADPAFTMRAYTHLMPASADRTRRAIDRVFGDDPDRVDEPAAMEDGHDPSGHSDGLETA
jgi:hypothetical protein